MCSTVCSADAPFRYSCSKVDPYPEPGHECVGNPTSTTGPDDVLQVGLEAQCVPEKPEAVGQLERRLISLHSDGGIRLQRAPLRVLQIIAELPENDAEAAPVPRPRREKAAEEEASGGKKRHQTDGLVGRDEDRAGDAETAVAARIAEPNQHLIEQAIEAPVPPSDAGGVAARDCGELGELAVVVPAPHLVVADEALVAWKTVVLVSSLPNGEEGPVHRPIQAVMPIVADGRIAVIHAALHVRPLRRSPLDESAPRGVGVGGHARRVEEDARRIAVEAVLYQHVVVGGHEEIVPGGDAADSELDAVVQKLLPVGHIDEADRIGSEDRLHGEDVADVLPRKVGAEALRHGELE